MRFDEHEAIERSFGDAIAEVRYEYYEEVEKRQTTDGADAAMGENSEANSSSERFPEGTKDLRCYERRIITVTKILRNFNLLDK
jgi:hypothetical protein